jgi:hypothetical protein
MKIPPGQTGLLFRPDAIDNSAGEAAEAMMPISFTLNPTAGLALM